MASSPPSGPGSEETCSDTAPFAPRGRSQCVATSRTNRFSMRRCRRSCSEMGTGFIDVEIDIELMFSLRKADTTKVEEEGVPSTLPGSGPLYRTRAPFGRT
jgi:hypothetical protein